MSDWNKLSDRDRWMLNFILHAAIAIRAIAIEIMVLEEIDNENKR